jgi:EAL domain-containing protein (putative c-di-GMP-specific phosphodiesterase class I)
MNLGPSGLMRVLLAVVGVECAVAVVLRVGATQQVIEGEHGPENLLGVAGLVWVGVLAAVGVLVARRLRELDRQVAVQGVDLAEATAPRLRLTAIVHRTERLLADVDSPDVALQPIIDVVTGRWVAVEALARFPDGVRPDHWFADAHEAGVGTELELRMLERSVRLLPHLPAGVELSVNASPALILDPGFGEVVGCFGQPDRLVVEITEHASVSRYEDVSAALLPLRERGIRLAVDDTGAGYASFAHVLRLRPDVIKIDRSMVCDIDHDAARRAFVTAVVLMALEMGARVTAEGVETAAELNVLATLGVDTVQGYLLARPSTDPAAWARWGSRDWLVHTGAGWRGHVREPLDVTYGGRAPA